MKNLFMLIFAFVLSISLMFACTASEQTATKGGEVKKEAVETATSAGQVKEPAAEAVSSGEALFKRHCAVCHRNGGNIVNPKKTLHKDAREAHGIKTADDIIKTMRNPGPGMNMFDETEIPDKDAKKIAEYILKTY